MGKSIPFDDYKEEAMKLFQDDLPGYFAYQA